MPEYGPAFTETPTVRLAPFTGNSPGRTGFSDVVSLSRWRRRRLIRDIERQTESALLCYVSRGPSIGPDDVLHLHRMLAAVESGTPVDLLLNSPGGDIDAAEKMMHVLRQKTGYSGDQRGALNLIVPEAAKSAATLMALGADQVIMGDTSELGPIDPQVPVEEDGLTHWYPVLAYLRAHKVALERCEKHPQNPAFRAELRRFNPVMVEQLELAIDRTRQIASNMLRPLGRNPTLVPSQLMDINRFPSHSQMIDWQTAQALGMEHVRDVDDSSDEWLRYWRLYVELRKVAGARKKVFESRHLSLIV